MPNSLLPHTTSICRSRYHAYINSPRSSCELIYVRSTPGSSKGKWKVLPRPDSIYDRGMGHDIVWRPGCTSLLAVNRQVHEETASMLYGDNTFVVSIGLAGIRFPYRCWTSNGLISRHLYAFLKHFSRRNLLRVRRYVINVSHYTGMREYYGCDEEELTASHKGKVAEAVRLLGDAKEIYKLHLHLIDGAITRETFRDGSVHRVQEESNYEQTQAVLEPFKTLRGVRRVDVSGVKSQYAKTLEETMSLRVE